LSKKKWGGVNLEISQAFDTFEAYSQLKIAKENPPLDIVFLDIRLPNIDPSNKRSGADIGIKLRKEFPETKIIIGTFYDDSYRINNLIDKIDPDALLIKGDIKGLENIASAVLRTLNNKHYYSTSVIEIMRTRVKNPHLVDAIDRQILHELSNGARMKELLEQIPLSKSGIEKRIRQLWVAFNIESHCYRELVICAKEKGFI